jgi:DNA-binding transcriptional MerR regulator
MSANRSGKTHDDANTPQLAYTRTEAAKLLGINPITLDRLAKRGLIRPSRAIRRPLYPHTELVRFLEETKTLEL